MVADRHLGRRRRGSTATAGLWGLDTGDRLAGERAPAGPKYTRTGTVRQSWNDPLGFVGLASVGAARRRPARSSSPGSRRSRRSAPTVDRGGGRPLGGAARRWGSRSRALGETSGRRARTASGALHEVAEGEARLATLRPAPPSSRRRSPRPARLPRPRTTPAGAATRARTSRTPPMPEPPDTTNRRVFAETWAALSVGVLVLALAVILWFRAAPDRADPRCCS